MNLNAQVLLDGFSRIYGDSTGVNVYFAPGRVNLIGEHTDYNGGHVFPCALTNGTYGAVKKRNDGILRFFSANFEDFGVVEVSLNNLINDRGDGWANYPKGVIKILIDEGYDISSGMDLYYYGNIPNSSGLSSSASIEVLTAFLCKSEFVLDFDLVKCALLCQKSENEFNGVQCGIMDQFAIAMGQKDKAIFLDTNTLEYEYANLELGDYTIVIMNTNKKRGLADSKYNERRKQCEEALRLLQKKYKIRSLGELSSTMLEHEKSVFSQDTLYRRAKHAVSENERTVAAKEALNQNDLIRFGELLNASGDSLREDYEVTGMELDTLVEAARKQKGVLGARMTGAGFGGCAIALVPKDKRLLFEEEVQKIYISKVGYKADFYEAMPGNGPIRL